MPRAIIRFLLPLPLFTILAPAAVQVTVNNSNGIAHASGASLSASMSVTAGGSNTVAVACIMWNNTASLAVTTTPTYGGQTMTAAGAAAMGTQYGNYFYAQPYYLVGPPTGSNTLALGIAGAHEIYANIVSFNGVNQTTPVRSGTYQNINNTTANPSMTITSNTSDLTITCVSPYASALSGGTLVTASSGSYGASMGYSTVGASSVTQTYTASANAWGMAGFSVMPQPQAPALSLSGCPSSGNIGAASATCTIATSQSFDGVHSVTITDSNTMYPGTLTPSVGSPGTGSVTVTPSNGATSFTVTYTPSTVIGTRTLTTTNNFSPAWTNVAWTYTATSAQSCAFTMTGSGTQSIAATSGWTSTGGCGHSSPTMGDSLAVTASGGTMTITVPNDGAVHFLGTCPSANTVYDLQLTAASSGSAVFDVQPGARFYFCGNKLLTAPSSGANGVPATWADLKYETGATVYEDEAQASYAHRTTTAATSEWTRLLWGSSGDTCVYGPGTAYSCPTNVTAINVGSVNPVMYDPGSTTDSHVFKVYGTGITGGCGSATAGCFTYATDANAAREAYADAGAVYFGGDVFNATGGIQSASGFNVISQINIAGSRFVNDLQGANPGGGASLYMRSCSVTGNYFSGTVGGGGPSPCYFIGNVFAHGQNFGGSAAYPLGAFSWNVDLLDCATGNPYTDRAIAAPVLFNYVSCYTNAGSNHGLSDSTWSETYRGNTYETLTAGSSEGHFALAASGTPTTNTSLLLDNMSLPAANGLNSGQIYGWGAATQQSVGYIDHNGGFGVGDYSWLILLEHVSSAPMTTTVLRTFRSNLGWAPSVQSANLALNTCQGCAALSAQMQAVPNNFVYVPNEAYNAWYNAASDNTFNTTLGDTNCNPSTSSNTPYNQCTASGTPGAHDIAANPKLVDPTRGMFKWASVMQGQAANLSGAQAAFQGCQNLLGCIMQLEWWVRAGYQPTNLALKGAAHDGKVVGVTGTPGSGYSGACTATISQWPNNQDTDDLGFGATATCTFVGGVPSVTITNPGMHYRVATPATVTITGAGGGGTSLNVVVSPGDIGPVPITLFAGVAP